MNGNASLAVCLHQSVKNKCFHVLSTSFAKRMSNVTPGHIGHMFVGSVRLEIISHRLFQNHNYIAIFLGFIKSKPVNRKQ